MPVPLPIIDLSTAVAGSTGQIDLTSCAPTSNPVYTRSRAILRLYNESGAGLRLTGQNTGVVADLPAGAWLDLPTDAGEIAINYDVLYVLPNAFVTSLIATYYAPGETPGAGAALGNSPISVGSTVLQATQVLQTGQPTGTSVVFAKPDSGVSTTAEASINNDGTAYFGVGPNGLNPLKRISWDNAGNVQIWQLTILNPILLAAGIQETGRAGSSNDIPASGIGIGPVVNFKQKMTNTPSSITTSVNTSVNVGTGAQITRIDLYGFQLFWLPGSSGASDLDVNYTTVGN